MKKFVFFTFLCFVLSALHSFAQNKNIDSLQTLLKTSKPDTNKVIHLYLLTHEFELIGNYEKGISYGKEAVELASKLNFKKGIANANNNIGLIYLDQANYPNALGCFLKALKIDEELNNKNGIAMRLGNIGIVYYRQADYSQALDYYFRALKMDKELDNKNGIARHLGNIGIVYSDQGTFSKALDYYLMALKMDEELGNKNTNALVLVNIGVVYANQAEYSKALDYYFKALKISEELGNKSLIGTLLNNIGIIYYDQKKYSQSLSNYGKALEIYEELGDKNEIGTIFGNIGSIYYDQKEYPKSLEYHFKALNIAEELGDKKITAVWLGNIGSIYTTTGKFKEAEQYLKRALAMNDSIDAKDYLRQDEQYLSQLYDTIGRYKEALIHYKKSIVLKDTLFNQENKKQLVRKEMNYEFEKKEAAAKAEQDIKDAVTATEKRKQLIIICALVIGIILIIVISLLLVSRNRIKQKEILKTALLKQYDLRTKAIIETQEQERKRIAQDLHDGIGQTIVSIKMNILSKAKFISEENQNIVQQTITSLDEIYKEVRILSHSMMPKGLQETGLIDAIEDLLERVSADSALKYSFEKNNIIRFDENIEVGLYRIFQELVNNILKHANASEIGVHLNKTKQQIILMVEDNGVGINPNLLDKKNGIGLVNIDARVHALNGTFSINPGENRGTVAVVRIPFK